MERIGEVDGRVAIARGADELRALGSCEQQLQPLGRERLIIGNQYTQKLQSRAFISTGIVSETLYPPELIGPNRQLPCPPKRASSR